MATSLEQILGKTINSTKELREEIKRLQDELVKTEAGTAEWDATTKKLVAAQERLTSVTKANKVETQAAADSIAGMEKEYKNLYNQYKLLTEEERNNPFGRQMAASLEELSNKLNASKKEVGNFKDNIGRYTESAVQAFGQMGISIGGLQGPLKLANGSLKAFNQTLAANPIMWIIAALKVLTGIFNKVKDAIAGNEESQMALNEAMSAFQPIIDAVQNSMDKLGQVVVKVIGWLADAFRTIREIGAAVTDFLGITDGANAKIKEQNKLYQDLAKSKNELTKAQREATKLNASQNAEVRTLLDQAAATTGQKEKLELLNQAKEIQNQITERNIALAEENLRILQTEASLTANDATMNDKLAQAEAAVAQARAEGAAKTKEMSSQIASLTKQTDAYAEKLKKEKEQLNELLKTIDENGKTDLEKLEEKYKEEKALLEKYGKDTTKLTYQYENERTKIKLTEWKQSLEASKNLLKEAADNYNEVLSLNTSFAKIEMESAEKLVNDTQELNEKYKESAKLTEEDIKNSWKTVGDVFGTAIDSYEGALLMLDVLKKRYEKAVQEQSDFGKKDFITKNNDAEIAKEVELLDLKVSLMKDETLSEEKKAELIKTKEQELWDFKQQNLLNELDLTGLTNEEKLALLKEYYNREKDMRDKAAEDAKEAAEKEREAFEKKYDAINRNIDVNVGLLDSIGALSDAIAQNIERTKDDEKTTAKAAEKKKKQLIALQKAQLAVSLMAIAGETASGIMSLWKAYAGKTAANNTLGLPPAIMAANAVDLASTIAQTVGMATMGAANMAAAVGGYVSNVKSIKGGEEGGAAAAVAAPAQIDTTAYTYTRQLQTEEEEEALNRPIWVSVTDIEQGLNNVKVREEESTF